MTVAVVTVAVVTGGASGLDLALGERCATLGMDVTLLDLGGERAATEATRLAGAHGFVLSVGARYQNCDRPSAEE